VRGLDVYGKDLRDEKNEGSYEETPSAAGVEALDEEVRSDT
jgi:hypothetical protein